MLYLTLHVCLLKMDGLLLSHTTQLFFQALTHPHKLTMTTTGSDSLNAPEELQNWSVFALEMAAHSDHCQTVTDCQTE